MKAFNERPTEVKRMCRVKMDMLEALGARFYDSDSNGYYLFMPDGPSGYIDAWGSVTWEFDE